MQRVLGVYGFFVIIAETTFALASVEAGQPNRIAFGPRVLYSLRMMKERCVFDAGPNGVDLGAALALRRIA